MPTGYTADLMDKGLPFRTFVLRCARAFGACIHQRDEGMDSLPRKEKGSPYAAKALAEAEKKLKQLRALSPKRQLDYGEEQRIKDRANVMQTIAKYREENDRLDKMADKVRAWAPPSTDHEGLKAFMLEQIKISRHDLHYSEERLGEVEKKTAETYFIEAVSLAVNDVAYYKKEAAKDQERIDSRNEWIDQLYGSLPK